MKALEETSAGGQNSNLDQLIRLLEFEIERIEKERSWPGWTQWALLGSLAAILMVILSNLEQQLNVQNVLFALLLSAVSIDILPMVAALVQPDDTSWHPGGRFLSMQTMFAPTRLSVVIIVIRYAALIFVALQLRNTLGNTFFVSACILSALVALAAAIVFFFGYFELPVRPVRNAWTWLSWTIALAAAALVIASMVWHLFHQTVVLEVVEIRVGILAAAGSWIISKLPATRPRTPFLEALVTIRRQIGLGRLSIEQAIQSFEIAMWGMTVSGYLQNDIDGFLSKLATCGALYDEGAESLNRAAAGVEAAGLQPSEDEMKAIAAELDRAHTQIRAAHAKHGEARSAQRGIDLRVGMISRLSPESGPELVSELNKLQQALDSMRARFETFEAGIGGTSELVAAAMATQSRSGETAEQPGPAENT